MNMRFLSFSVGAALVGWGGCGGCSTPPAAIPAPRDPANTAVEVQAHVTGHGAELPDFEDHVPRLRDVMLDGLERTTPNWSAYRPSGPRVEGETPFDGSLDWHSNVLAHWALLVIARTRGDEELRARLLSRLTPAALERERALLGALDLERPSWLAAGDELPSSFPYDQAWLLMLLAELERHLQPLPASVRAFRIEVQDRLLDWLESSPFPETYALPSTVELGHAWMVDSRTRVTAPAFVGAYNSWIFAWLAVALSHPVGAEAAARVEQLGRERIAPNKQALLEFRPWNEQDFLWLPSLLAIADVVAREGSEPTWFRPGSLEELPRSVSRKSAHSFGVEVSKLWGLAVQAECGDERARTLLQARFADILARPDLWAEDFESTGHWIPQYLWFAVWLSEGRP